jgi:hypothetical protein
MRVCMPLRKVPRDVYFVKTLSYHISLFHRSKTLIMSYIPPNKDFRDGREVNIAGLIQLVVTIPWLSTDYNLEKQESNR